VETLPVAIFLPEERANTFYSATVAQLHTLYEVPQGNRRGIETLWNKLVDKQGIGLKAVCLLRSEDRLLE
jgi:hypothetical protein